MATVVTKTVKPGGGGDYSSLSAFESGEQRDLTSVDEIARAECYGGLDTTSVVISGWTTSSTQYIDIVAAAGAEAQMPYDTSGTAYRLEGGSSSQINIGNDYVHVTAIQVTQTSTSPGRYVFILDAVGIVLDRVHARLEATGSVGRYAYNIYYDSHHEPVYLKNCVATLTSGTSTGSEHGIQDSNGRAVIWNCTVAGVFDYGISGGNGTEVWNTITYDTVSDGFHSGDSWVGDNNASSDATAPGTNALHSISDPFVDSANGDYHITSGSSLVGAGYDLSSSFTDDFDGETRSSWDIGADEYVVTVYSISGTTTGTSSLSGAITARLVLLETLAGTSSMSLSAITLRHLLSETLSGTSSVVGGTTLRRLLSGTVSGTSSLAGIISGLTLALTGLIQGTSSLQEQVMLRQVLSETLQGTSATAVSPTLRRYLAEAVAGTSALSEMVRHPLRLDGFLQGTSSMTLAEVILIQLVNDFSTRNRRLSSDVGGLSVNDSSRNRRLPSQKGILSDLISTRNIHL